MIINIIYNNRDIAVSHHITYISRFAAVLYEFTTHNAIAVVEWLRCPSLPMV